MMNEIVDLTTEEEEDSNIFPSYIKSEATTTVYVDLTMSPSPSPSPKKRKENKITSYFPISPSKKVKLASNTKNISL